MFFCSTPKFKHHKGPVIIEYDTDPDIRRSKLSKRKRTTIKRLYELHTICGGTVFLKFIQENQSTYCYSSSNVLWATYKKHGLKPSNGEKRLVYLKEIDNNLVVDMIGEEMPSRPYSSSTVTRSDVTAKSDANEDEDHER